MGSIGSLTHIVRSTPDIEVNIPSIEAAIEAIVAKMLARQGCALFTVNLDHMVKMRTDPAFLDAYVRATLVLADGWPIVWLLRRQGETLKRATGADLLEPLCARAAELGLPTFFIGPSERSLTAGLAILQGRHAGLRVAGADCGVIARDEIEAAADAYAAGLRRSGAALCVLSLGAPKQELLADALRRRCPDIAFICVGAAMDFISGEAPRAPKILQQLGLEWLWRMSSDPARLCMRYAACMALFAELALRSAVARKACGLKGQLTPTTADA